MVIRLVNGIAVGIASTATGTIIAQILPATRRGEGIGYYSMSTTLATAIGPFLGLMLAQHVSYFVIFMVCCGLGLFALIVAFTTKIAIPTKTANVS